MSGRGKRRAPLPRAIEKKAEGRWATLLRAADAHKPRLALMSGIAVSVAAAVIVRAVFLFKDSFATGFDGYYYALQVTALIRYGELLNADNSIAFYILRFFALFSSDPVLSNKVAVILLCSLAAVPFYLLAFRFTSSHLAALAAAVFFSLSFSQIYMSFEIVKNGLSVLFAAGALYCLARCFDKKRWAIGAAACFALGFLTHKATAGALIVFALVYFVAMAWLKRKTVFSKWRPLHFVLAGLAAAAVVLAVVLSVSTLRLLDLENFFDQVSFQAIFKRFEMFVTQVSNLRIKGELFLLYAVPVAFIPFLVKKLRDKEGSAAGKAFLTAAYATQWVLINPAMEFSWISTSYRLLLMSVLFAALEAGIMLSFLPALRKRPWRAAAAAVVLALVLFTLPGMYRRFHADRYPPYREYRDALFGLKSRLTPADKLVAETGMDYFIWYETGIYAQHFFPPGDAGWYRLVYGLGPAHFERYRGRTGFEEPVPVKPPFVLVKESVWRMFTADHPDLEIIKRWQNPSQERPPFVYGVKAKFERSGLW